MKRENELRIVGKLGNDPDMRYLPSGKEVTQFSLAVNDGYKPKGSEEWVNQTVWYRVSVFGDKAGLAKDRLHKGQEVKVVGKLTYDKKTGGPRIWEDKDGNARASFEVLAFNIQTEDDEMNQDEELPF